MDKKTDSSQQISLVDRQGRKEIFNVLFTFRSDDFHKSYILIYPRHLSKDSQVDIRAYSLPFDEDPANPEAGQLKPIKTKAEWDMVESVLDALVGKDRLD